MGGDVTFLSGHFIIKNNQPIFFLTLLFSSSFLITSIEREKDKGEGEGRGNIESYIHIDCKSDSLLELIKFSLSLGLI